jgi:histidinol-phosphate aminotransferase
MLSAGSDDYPPASILLNSNESAFGPGAHARQAAIAASADIERYLENPARLLAPALARHHALDAARIAIGAGSDDLLARLARAYLDTGSEMIRSRNGYLKTPNYAHANNAIPIAADDIDFTPSVDAMLRAVTDKTRMVYLANPENPAGSYLPGSEIRRLHQALPASVLLVLDCAYEEYVDAPDYEPAQLLAESAANVVMTRTFSKIHGLAGARVGWMYGAPEVTDMVTRIGLTFPLASSSIHAALAALDDVAHQRRVFDINRELRAWFSAAMADLGLRAYPSQTNFVLLGFGGSGRGAADCDDFLRRRGIAIRRFASPAYADCIRVTIGHRADMQAARDAIAQFLRA